LPAVRPDLPAFLVKLALCTCSLAAAVCDEGKPAADNAAAPDLVGKHTIFGKCAELDVVEKITHTPHQGQSTERTGDDEGFDPHGLSIKAPCGPRSSGIQPCWGCRVSAEGHRTDEVRDDPRSRRPPSQLRDAVAGNMTSARRALLRARA
jgi:hypothetical protein